MAPAGERPLRFARRMTDTEALMWTVEKDPALRSSFLQITLLDRAPDFERLRARLDRASQALPRLRQRVVSPPGRLAPPEWADDERFDLDYHVRRIALPHPGSDRQLLDLAARLYEDPFDRARPLWSFTVVEALQGGRAALLGKMHHTITDGVGGVRLSMQFIDIAPDPDEPPVVTDDRTPEAERNLPAMLADAAGHGVRRQLGSLRRTAAGAAGLVTHPTRVPALAADGVTMAGSLVRQLAVTEPAHSPLWRHRSVGRHFEILSVDLDAVKRSAKALGGTVNDLFVAAVAGGAGAYHRDRGAPVDELRMAMPVNRRTDGSAGGNAFSPVRVLVPAGLDDPRERFTAVHERLSVVKRERAVGLIEGLAGLANRLPTAVLVRVARAQAGTIDFTTSNIPAAPFDLYVAGAQITGNHPMGPTAGTAFNATAMSYRNGFDIGLNVDTAAVDDPADLAARIIASFEGLFKATRTRKTRAG